MYSVVRTLSTRPQRPSSVMGKRSLAKPGSIPPLKKVVPPSLHAASTGSSSSLGVSLGLWKTPILVSTTFLPARRAAVRFSMLTAACIALGPK
jgi:hypothetical protein